jgi:gliding motility-associated-like protein
MKKILFALTALIFSLSQANAQNGFCSVTVTPMDTTVCMGDSVQVVAVANLLNAGQAFNFNTASLPAGWNVAGTGQYSSPCGQNPTNTPYYWASTAGNGTPQITSAAFDVFCGGFLMFDMAYAVQGGASPCEGPDLANEGVSLQYSTNGGATWTTIIYYSPGGFTLPTQPTSSASVATGQTPYTTWSTFTVPIPAAAQTTGTMFRWIQFNSSGTCCDNWGLDNIVINATGSPCGETAVVNWSNGLTDTTSFWVVPYADTTYQAFVYDTVGIFQCQSQIININVFPDQMTYSLVDTAYSYCPTFSPTVEVTNLGNANTPFTFDWSTPSTTNPTILPSTGEEQDTVTYYVTITDGCGYTRDDSVVLVINQLLQIDDIIMGPATCEPTGYVSVMISGQTTTPQTGVSYNWSGPGPNSPNFINASVWTDLSSGWYYVNVTDAVCEVNDSVFVDILNPPSASFTANPTSGCSPLDVLFTNNSQNANYYEWDFGNGNVVNSNDLNPLSEVFTSNSVVTLTAFQDENCFDEETVNITIGICGCTDPIAINYDPTATVDDGSCIPPTPTVIAPNVFSPNSDGSNDEFFLTTTNAIEVELIITNRWGNVMYSGKGLNPSWNGKTENGNDSNEGSYFYKYIVTGYANMILEGHGFLQLTR